MPVVEAPKFGFSDTLSPGQWRILRGWVFVFFLHRYAMFKSAVSSERCCRSGSLFVLQSQWFKGPTNAKDNLGIGKVSDASVQVMRSARPKWASSLR